MAAGDKLAKHAQGPYIREIQQRHKGRYGYRRMSGDIAQRRPSAVNGKVVRRLMAELDLKCTVSEEVQSLSWQRPDASLPTRWSASLRQEEPNRR